MYNTYSGKCRISDWKHNRDNEDWEGMEHLWHISSGDEIGLLLDLDEGSLSVYKNGRKLGVMKRGLAGHYCWVLSMFEGTSVTIKRGKIPPS